MRLHWTHLFRSRRYRHGTAAERRMIELRYAIAQALRTHRRRLRMTQRQLAKRMGADQSTISRLERASLRVTFDYAIYAFIALNVSDAEIAEAINASARADIQTLRGRMNLRLAQRPAPGFRRRDRARASARRCC